MRHTLPVGRMAANCYILSDPDGKALIIDPGDDGDYIAGFVRQHALDPVAVCATHGHFDHVMAASELQLIFGVPFLMHAKDAFLLKRMADSAEHFLGYRPKLPPPVVDRTLSDGETLAYGSASVTVLAVPGHTPGSIAFADRSRESVFVGDTVFAAGAVGRTDHAYSDAGMLRRSLERILSMPGGTTLLPGHGPATTVAREARFHAPGV